MFHGSRSVQSRSLRCFLLNLACLRYTAAPNHRLESLFILIENISAVAKYHENCMSFASSIT